jgi:CBS domain-containing protein
MQVSELLQNKGAAVVVIEQTATISEALERLRLHNIGALVVSGDGKEIQGILSERDIVRALARQGSSALEVPVQSFMSSDVHTCDLGDSVESLTTVMTNLRVRHIPVVAEGVLAGIISIGDVVKARMEELEKDRDALVNYINAR